MNLLTELAEEYLALPGVAAVLLSGSRATRTADRSADHDVYVLTVSPPSPRGRAAIAERRARSARELDLSPGHFDDGDAWIESSGAKLDVMFWDVAWLTDLLEHCLLRHRPSIGYSTAHWATTRNWQLLGIKQEHSKQLDHLWHLVRLPYPDPLAEAIVSHNHSLLRGVLYSLEFQLATAAERGDLLAVQHRSTAILASWTDIIFAVNRTPHPGEKRLLERLAELDDLPNGALSDAAALASGGPAAVTRLLDRLEAWLDARRES